MSVGSLDNDLKISLLSTAIHLIFCKICKAVIGQVYKVTFGPTDSVGRPTDHFRTPTDSVGVRSDSDGLRQQSDATFNPF